MTKEQTIELIKNIDFGDIDGYGDPNLERYFIDNNYWEKIINKNIFFVIGKKGTGKSSIYRMLYEQSSSYGALVENKDFGEFPFEKLLSLSDDDFSKPNQYQSIWQNVILNLFAQMIYKSENIYNANNMYYQQIYAYVSTCIGDNIVDLHRELLNKTQKTEIGLTFDVASLLKGTELQSTFGNGMTNLSKINSQLMHLITNYLITIDASPKFIIQFDRLDDNYNQYQNVEEYYHAIISLFKTVYYINQQFRSKKIDTAKTIVYLRSDILSELAKRDSESARWDDFRFDINWAIINKDDWDNPLLLQMVDKRIQASLNDPKLTFRTLFDNETINLTNIKGILQDVFKYVVDQTMHRPRDVIKFCKCIQKEVIDTNQLYFRTIKNAEKQYTNWLLNSEIANEINPILHNLDALHELLKLIGSKPFSIKDFNMRYKSVSDVNMNANDLINYLYETGIILNIDLSKRPPLFRSIIRNNGKLDRNQKMIIHSGVWKGLNS